jgi:hypothetical protein
MLLEIDQEVQPAWRNAVPVELGDGGGEAVVDANEGRGDRPKFFAEPLGKRPRRVQYTAADRGEAEPVRVRRSLSAA